MTADRELRAETVIDAPPEKVWATLTDLSRMPEWSPELLKMVPLKRGGLRLGQWYLGVNRRKAMVWHPPCLGHQDEWRALDLRAGA